MSQSRREEADISYKTEIASFDVATGRSDKFGEGHYDSRCLLVYSGIRESTYSKQLTPQTTMP